MELAMIYVAFLLFALNGLQWMSLRSEAVKMAAREEKIVEWLKIINRKRRRMR